MQRNKSITAMREFVGVGLRSFCHLHRVRKYLFCGATRSYVVDFIVTGTLPV